MGCKKLNIRDYFKFTDSDTGSTVAEYNYTPFGALLSQSGTMADEFTYKFSTKPMDQESGLSYYNYRYYSPELGRWLSRDPIEEEGGGLNLYIFINNSPIRWFDLYGLSGMHQLILKLLKGKELNQKISMVVL